MSRVLNLAGYRFVRLDDLASLRARLFDAAAGLDLKGTVILAAEGINLNLAGAARAAERWLDALCADPRFSAIEVQRSTSAATPFRHLRMKIKHEIIRMNRPAVAPGSGRAPAVDSSTLQRWLPNGRDDDGRPLVLLDARNAFEVDAGSFNGAMDWRLGRFSDFPHALSRHAGALRDKAVVSYCTGGIRCEKATLVLREAGVHALQLDGGILRYFEDTHGSAPGWRGHCVVFDERGSVDANLRPAAELAQ
jgi:UPF0176 protein